MGRGGEGEDGELGMDFLEFGMDLGEFGKDLGVIGIARQGCDP